MNTIFIGIAGGTGSGKTTLTEHLAARFGSDISVVHHDNYYKRQDRPFAERCLQNYDHPDAFDTDLMIEDLKALKQLFPISTSKRIVFSMMGVEAARKLEEAKASIKAWEDVKRVNQGIVMQELGDAELGVLPDGTAYQYKSVVQQRQAQAAKTLTVRTLRKVKGA